MRKSRTMLISLAFLILSSAAGAQSASQNRLQIPREPSPNLGKLKTRLIAYHDCLKSSECYASDLNRQSELAIAYLRRRVENAKRNEKMALVLDIDETALSNWDEEKQDDFGYIPKDWNEWVNERRAPAIEGTLRLYKEALKLQVSVFFITGRGVAEEAATADNLRVAGYTEWAGLALRGSHPPGQTVTEYKSGERQKIVDAGYRIILNVGDQLSDLNGSPQAELSVKLPNPFYYIP